ncbi:hypothetical protein N7G274_010181 [Stereocaulon virgatum]|uniref:Uncharacterized protein n=1 Tax=Stereocaulon virgatum TaxID=373712 RepID=A0ABR3ZX05_9LECA
MIPLVHLAIENFEHRIRNVGRKDLPNTRLSPACPIYADIFAKSHPKIEVLAPLPASVLQAFVSLRHGISQPASFRFLDLPLEIREMIYGFCLVAKGTLRGDSELSTILYDYTKPIQEPVLLFDGPQIFRTCRLISEEAPHVFYSINHFHFTTYGHVNQWPCTFQKHFGTLRHIGLEFLDNVNWGGRLAHADRNNAQLVKALAKSCLQLRSFAFYVLTNPSYGPWTPFHFDYLNIMVSLDLTAHALSLLREHVDTLSIVAYGRDDAQEKLRSQIAEEPEWREHILDDWPRVTMSRRHHERLLRRRDFLPMEQIREWSTYRSRRNDTSQRMWLER